MFVAGPPRPFRPSADTPEPVGLIGGQDLEKAGPGLHVVGARHVGTVPWLLAVAVPHEKHPH